MQAGSSAASAAAAAVLGDRAAPLAQHLSNYLGACSAAECEVGALPFGFAQRLLEEAGFSFSIGDSPLRARDQRGGSDEQQRPKRARA